MSGHSKWANIKHKKAATDAKRGKAFTKILKEITVAARTGGGDQDANPRLRTAIDNAKSNNIPLDTVNRAIKKGTGELEGVHYDEYTYEGYGPNGVALILEIMTDNKQRTVSEIRHLLTKFGGNLGESGSVAWNFNRKGKIIITSKKCWWRQSNDGCFRCRCRRYNSRKDNFEIITSNKDFNTVKEDLKSKNIQSKMLI